MHTKRALTTGIIIASFVSVVFVTRAADQPTIAGISPTNGVMGTLISITGTNFTESNTIDWGFGRAVLHATGNPSGTQTISVRLGNDCAGGDVTPCGSVPIGGEGLVDIRVTNANGTSNKATFLLKSHASACYAVDATANGPVARKLDCNDLECEVGNCVESEPDPTPAASTPTPTPTPSPTPSVDVEEDEDDEDDNGSGNGNSSSGSSSNSGSSSSNFARGPSAADRAAADFIQNSTVPTVVQSLYEQVYEQPITVCSSHYWKIRARNDKATRSKLLGAMLWQKARGRNPIFRSCFLQQQAGRVAGATTGGSKIAAADINRLFRQTHNGVNPTVAQNQYWLGRLADKPTEAAMLGAMQWHALNGTGY